MRINVVEMINQYKIINACLQSSLFDLKRFRINNNAYKIIERLACVLLLKLDTLIYMKLQSLKFIVLLEVLAYYNSESVELNDAILIFVLLIK